MQLKSKAMMQARSEVGQAVVVETKTGASRLLKYFPDRVNELGFEAL